MPKDSTQGAITDEKGHFSIDNVPFGIHSLHIKHLGYEEKAIRDIGVYDTKGVFIKINLKQASQGLEEIIISAQLNPVESTDPMALLSARSISIEETKRFAGSLGDPSRMALSYAGVNNGRGDNNDLIIRGNSAKYLQWKLEGLAIPNPNHFGVHGSTGGLLSILNSNNLGSSNFYLGAFPANTGNAIAGVFDLSLRNGNLDKHKHSLEASLLGLSASSEGPLNAAKNSSYIVNYRYSTLGLLKNMGVFFQAPEYQDLTFKLNLPTQKAGVFSIYGLGGLGTSLEEDFFRRVDFTQFTINPRGDTIYGFQEIAAENLEKYNLGLIGAKHSIQLTPKLLLSNHINISSIYNTPKSADVDKDSFTTFLQEEGRFSNTTLRYQPELTAYLNANNTLLLGATISWGSFKSKLIEGFSDRSTKTILDHTANTLLTQGFVSYKKYFPSKIFFCGRLTLHLFQPQYATSDRAQAEHSVQTLR